MKGSRLPEILAQEIDELEETIAQFKKGEVTATELKVRRVPFGVYEQRDKDTFMVRIRNSAGYVSPVQLEKIAELSDKYGDNRIHVTTRQEIQLHYVLIDSIIPVIRELKEVGLSSRGGGGNTVRNLLAEESAGIDPAELFDASPYCIALTSRLVNEADSWTLPRKFKIDFSNSDADNGHATITDIGYIPRMQDSVKGFKVYVAGGLGAKWRVGDPILDFIPDTEVYNVARAVKTLFWKYGNRKNKHAARLRFLWNTLGEEEFKKRFFEEYEAVKAENYPPLEIEEIDNSSAASGVVPEKVDDEEDFQLWKKRFTWEQKQKGLYAIIMPIEMGFLENDKTLRLARFLKPFGDNVIRMSKDQNLLIRNIEEQYLTNVYNALKDIKDDFNRPFIFDKILSCAGASTCQLGICLSRGSAKGIMDKLAKSDIELDALSKIKLNISGCPNSCGQHPVADLGFFGKALRKDGRLYPAFNVIGGAVLGDGKTKLAEKYGEVAAKDVPSLVEDVFRIYIERTKGEKSFYEFINSGGDDVIRETCEKYKDVPSFDENEDYYHDWGKEDVFSLSSRGMGECSAGLFDLIEADIKNIDRSVKVLSELTKDETEERQEELHEIVYHSSRMLLMTRGVDAKTEDEVYDSFSDEFIGKGLVDPSYISVINAARKKDLSTLLEKEDQALALAERTKYLYDKMDDSFHFQLEGEEAPQAEKIAAKDEKSDRAEGAKGDVNVFKDFRGVGCPMNFVKTKNELASMDSKEKLEILLDDGAPIENVPGSVKAEGHKVLLQEKEGDYWRIIIEKE